MKKHKDFAQEKLNSLFEYSPVEFKITPEMEDNIKNLPERKKADLPFYRRRSFISACAACCVILLCLIIPSLNNGGLASKITADNAAPESNYDNAEENEIYSLLRGIFVAASPESEVSYNNDASCTKSAYSITVNRNIQYTMTASGGYIENICGNGQLNVFIAEVSCYGGGSAAGKTSIIIIHGIKGYFWCLGNTDDISGNTLKFSTENICGFATSPQITDIVEITIENNSFSYTVNGIRQNSFSITASGGMSDGGLTIS